MGLALLMKTARQLTAAETLTLEERVVDNPSYTDGLYYADASTVRDQRLRHTVTGNAMTRIGALCFIRARQPHHEQAAARFKSLYESLLGSGAPAVDPERQPVDTSPTAHDNGMAARVDGYAELRSVETSIGKVAFNRIVASIVLGVTCEEMADKVPSGQPNKRQVAVLVGKLLDALDQVAAHFKLATEAAYE